MFVWGLYNDFIYELLLLKIIFSMKRYYVYVWGDGFLYELLLLKIIFSVEMFVWGLYDGLYVYWCF